MGLGKFVKVIYSIGAIMQIIAGIGVLVVGLPTSTGTTTGGLMPLAIGLILIVWGILMLAGLSELQEKRKR